MLTTEKVNNPEETEWRELIDGLKGFLQRITEELDTRACMQLQKEQLKLVPMVSECFDRAPASVIEKVKNYWYLIQSAIYMKTELAKTKDFLHMVERDFHFDASVEAPNKT